MRPWAVRAFAVALLAAVVAPPLRDPPVDSFPLSTYPMFSHPRGAVTSLQLAVAIDEGGAVRRLPPEIVGGSREVIHAANTLLRAIRDDSVDELCGEIADRLGPTDDGAVIEVRTERYDVVGWFDGDREPRASTVHARCEAQS